MTLAKEETSTPLLSSSADVEITGTFYSILAPSDPQGSVKQKKYVKYVARSDQAEKNKNIWQTIADIHSFFQCADAAGIAGIWVTCLHQQNGNILY